MYTATASVSISLARSAQPRQCLGMKADAAVAVRGHADGQRHQFLVMADSAPASMALLDIAEKPAMVPGASARILAID
jgi:hypothetical protein